MTSLPPLRQRLRTLTALEGPFPPADFNKAGATPQQLFVEWLDTAIAAGITEPHAMTLSTVDADGLPDARVLILKNVDDRGWHFAISAASPKGRQLQTRPAVALTFYWQPLGRQVRIRGTAVPLSAAESAQDFLARSTDARASVLLERQSAELDTPASVASAMGLARARITTQPGLVAPNWRAYAVAPSTVEFWQGATDRLHKRLLFQRSPAADTWEKTLLWP